MKAQQELVDQWNAKHSIGTPVIRYKLIKPLREPRETKTRSVAWLMGGHSAMVMVEGIAGGVLVESVTVFPSNPATDNDRLLGAGISHEQP